MISRKHSIVNKNYLFLFALITQFACQGHQYNSFEMEEQGFQVHKSPSALNNEPQTGDKNYIEPLESSEIQFDKNALLLFGIYKNEVQKLRSTLEKVQFLQTDANDKEDLNTPFISSEPSFNEDESKFENLLQSLNAEDKSAHSEILAAINTIRQTQKYLTQAIEPKESNLPSENSSTAQNQKTYFELLEQDALDLNLLLQNNFYLKHIDTLQAIKSSILLGSENQETNANTASLTILNNIGEKLVSNSPNDMQNTEESESLALSPTAESVNIEELADDEEKLEKAESLASTGKFVEAIQVLDSISSESAMYDPAREKIIEFSDQGVNNLRRKAAQAFQSALPIADVETRSDYLKSAKTYLEDAKKNFPQSKQLTIVENNLKMINRKLNQARLR